MSYLLIGQSLAATVVIAWATSVFLLLIARTFGKEPPRLASAVFHELRPFYLPAVFGAYLADAFLNGVTGDALFALGSGLLGWWLFKDSGGDDDRWGRRRERLAERVAVVGGQLSVVPDQAVL